MTARKSLPYRPCVGVMLLNRAGQVFVGQRLDSTLEAWQMPQGGIDPGEPARDTALRELREETGIAPEHITIVAETADTLRYDLPDDLIGKVWGGKYRGQVQTWFLARFIGNDDNINIRTPHPEFRAWKWADPAELPAMIVPFKRALYQEVLDRFADHLRSE